MGDQYSQQIELIAIQFQVVRVLDATYGQISALGVVNTRAPRNIGCEIRDAIRYTTPGSRGSEDAIRARHEMTAR